MSLRNEQLGTILDLCRGWDEEVDLDVLLVGDFNCGFELEDREHLTSLNQFTDVWRHIWPEDPGYTFDPTSNTLAAVSHKPDAEGNVKVSTSKRCDRMFLSQSENWAPLSASLIKGALTTDLPLSDHFGLLFEFCDVGLPSCEPQGSQEVSARVLASKFLEDGGDAAFQSWRRVADQALRVLCQCGSKCGGMGVVEVGAGSAGVALPFSDVDVVMFGREHPSSFMHKLSVELSDAFKGAVVRVVNGAVMPCIRVSEVWPALDIQYVSSLNLEDEYFTTQDKAASSEECTCKLMKRQYAVAAIRQASSASLSQCLRSSEDRSVDALLDCQLLLHFVTAANKKLPKLFLLSIFRKTTRCVKLWAKRRGVYGASFGFPGGFAVSVMVAALMQLDAPKWTIKDNDKKFHLTCLRRFFEHYSAFPWAQETVTLDHLVDRMPVDPPL